MIDHAEFIRRNWCNRDEPAGAAMLAPRIHSAARRKEERESQGLGAQARDAAMSAEAAQRRLAESHLVRVAEPAS